MFISSDCKDTDFPVKLTEVDKNKVSKLLSDGILRVRYRNSLERTELMEPGKLNEIKVNVGATANTFFKGHKIRVSISSSNFPIDLIGILILGEILCLSNHLLI